MNWLHDLSELAKHDLYFLFLHQNRYWNPYKSEDSKILCNSPLFLENNQFYVFQQFLHDQIIPRLTTLPKGIYFPSPIVRAQQSQVELSTTLLEKFHYAFILVDKQGQWWLHGRETVDNVLKLFLSALSFDAELNRYVIEYWVDQFLDKSYLHCEMTPMRATQFNINVNGKMQILLNNQLVDEVLSGSLSIDHKNQLWCVSRLHGEVLFSSKARDQALRYLGSESSLVWGEHCEIIAEKCKFWSNFQTERC